LFQAARLRDERLFHMVFERLDHPSKGFVMEHVTDNFLFAFENLQALEVVRFKFRRVLKLERKEVEANEVTLTSHVVAGVPVPVAWYARLGEIIGRTCHLVGGKREAGSNLRNQANGRLDLGVRLGWKRDDSL
ncbi:hypothetical protein BN1723_002286, partial [Verticillium longisporum]